MEKAGYEDGSGASTFDFFISCYYTARGLFRRIFRSVGLVCFPAEKAANTRIGLVGSMNRMWLDDKMIVDDPVSGIPLP